jgi:hypothetical protein
MPAYLLNPYIPDLRVPRSYPCGALTAPETECGATPASLYRRGCGVLSHTREVWLCPVHASMAACGGAICRDCALRGGISPVFLIRLTEPLRFT